VNMAVNLGSDKTDNVCINTTLGRDHVRIVALEQQ